MMLRRDFGIAVACFAICACGAGKEPSPPAQPGTPAPSSPASTPLAFERMLEMQGIKFKVFCPNSSNSNKLEILPSGLEIDNSPITRNVEAVATGAEVADLNVDGSPEVYVFLQSTKSGSNGSLIAFAANNRKSLSEISLPALSDIPNASAGYRGHDEFEVIENTLVQRFPIYSSSFPDARPSGKTRQLQYKLAPGEAGWLLRLDRVVEY